MKHTLVLAVDRDDDFGVKGGVETPVIGIEGCIAAANALGIADPEDSDLNALYAAISTCKELRDDGIDADVALICGDEKVGHKSDLALISELEQVLDLQSPDNVVLIGDGAEDEYIYPIIASRSHVDSVRKVFVKQAPNIESSLYVFSKMLSEPNKRRRFVAPLGAAILIVSLFLFIPDLAIFINSGDVSDLRSLSMDSVLLIIGLGILMYGLNFGDKWTSFSQFIREKILSRGTTVAMTALAVGIVVICAIFSYYELNDTYISSWLGAGVYYANMMVWPIAIALMVYLLGVTIGEMQEDLVFRLSAIFDIVSVASLAMVIVGLLDVILSSIEPGYGGTYGVFEILAGLMMSLMSSFVKKQYRPKESAE